jgi:hypothetical protein
MGLFNGQKQMAANSSRRVAQVLGLILGLSLGAGLSVDGLAGSGRDSEIYKKAYTQMINAGKSGFQAEVYGDGFVMAKESGLTDNRAKEFASNYLRAYSSARDQGRKCPRDCEAYAADYARQLARSK